MTANALRLTRNVGFPKLTDSSAPASEAAAARKRVTATFAVEFNVRGAFANLAPGEAYANARNAIPLDHLLLRRSNQTVRKRTSLSGRFGSGPVLSGESPVVDHKPAAPGQQRPITLRLQFS
jgi:hypothetical protein